MSRFLSVYEPTEEGFGNWLKNTYIDFKDGSNKQQKVSAANALASAKFKEPLLKYIANLVNQKEAGGKLTNKISLSKWDNATKDYKERKRFIEYAGYVLCVEVDNPSSQEPTLKAIYVPMIPTDYKSTDDNWYSKMEFFPIPLAKIIAEANK